MKHPIRVWSAVALAALILVAGFAGAGLAQVAVPKGPRKASSTKSSKSHHKKAETPVPPADESLLDQYAYTNHFRLGKPHGFKITPAGDAVLFLRSGSRDFAQDLWSFDPATGKEKLLLTPDQILRGAQEHISPEERARRDRQRSAWRGVASYQLSEDGRRILVPLNGHLYVIERARDAVRELPDAAGVPIDARFSLDGGRVACVREGDLWVTDIDSDNGWRITWGANDTLTHGLAEFVAQEEMGRSQGYWWSPDGQQIAYEEARLGGVEALAIADPTHPERGARETRYPRAGTTNADVRLGLIPAIGGHTTWVEWDHRKYPYLCNVVWTKNAPLTLVVMNREQTEAAILSADRTTGGTALLHVERDRAWINLHRNTPKWLGDGSGFLWISERSGWPQVELHGADGKLVRVLNAPGLNLRELLAVDEAAGTVWVSGGPDPTQRNLYWLPLSGAGEPIRATTARGVHGAEFGPGYSVYVHTFDGADGEQRVTVHQRGGELLGEIRSYLEKPREPVRLELATVGDSVMMYAAIIRPKDFVAGRRYPVIVYVYGGPHGQQVFAQPSRYTVQQWLADRGYIVVTMDNRGTPARGRDWERVIKGNLIDTALADQVAGLRALGARYPEMDMSHVGIYGWSFGGYFSAMAVMRRPDVYQAGMAGAPVADWHDYDTFYTERYMGLPQENPKGYDASSVLTYAPKLERPLLIIHGTVDDNVYFMNSLKIADVLYRAGKPFEFIPLSGFTHSVNDPLMTVRLYERVADFFDRQLKGGGHPATVSVP